MSGQIASLRLLEQLVETQLKNFGFKAPVVLEAKLVDGKPSLYVNYSDATLSATDAAVQIRLVFANAAFADIAQQSINGSAIVAGPVSALVVAFAAASDGSTPQLGKLVIQTVQALNRNNIPTSLCLADPAGPVPALKGLNGATADANIPAALGIFQEAPLSSTGG